MQQAVTDYLNVQPVTSIADDPEFLVETDLTEYTIVSHSTGSNGLRLFRPVVIRRTANT